jgi:RNA polymerase sigma-70 factor (ECF subfamily)
MNDVNTQPAPVNPDAPPFHDWVDRYGPALFRLAISLSGNRLDAEDLCQETFVAAFSGFKNFDGRASVKTWLTSILMRRAAKLWRKERHARRALSLDRCSTADPGARQDPGGALAQQLSVASTDTDVDQRLDILQVIRTLPPEFRDAILLREIDQLSYQEIADVLAVPRGTVESRLHRGRAELRKKLTGYQPVTRP